MRFVASDLEGTLTAGETWRGVGRYLKRNGRGLAYRVYVLSRLPGILAAKAGVADEQRVRDGFVAGMARLFRGMARAELDAMAEWVVEEELWPKRREGVLGELQRSRTSGSRVVLAAGGYQPVLAAFARRLGAEAVGTPLEYSGGMATGRLMGAVNTGRAKAERLRERIGSGELYAAYGDTLADLFMLEMSENPVVVRPERRLRERASREGWRVLDA